VVLARRLAALRCRCGGCSPGNSGLGQDYRSFVSQALQVVIGDDDVLLREGVARLLAEA
jgi:hypothetical protein